MTDTLQEILTAMLKGDASSTAIFADLLAGEARQDGRMASRADVLSMLCSVVAQELRRTIDQ